MKKMTKMFVGVFCALLLVTSAFAADTVVTATNAPVAVETVKATNAPALASESWVLTLGGTGATTTGDNGSTAAGFDISLGRTGHLLLPLEAGLRQSIGYNDGDWVGNTRLYSDWTLLTWKKFDVFAGGAVGVQYGDGQKPSWEIAPEAGARYWLKNDVAIVGRAEVPWDLDGWEFKDSVRYFLGFQVKF